MVDKSQIIFPSPADMSLFINGVALDVAPYRIEWRVNRATTPIVNYRGTTASEFAIGPMLVEGALALNLIHPGYLTAAIEYNNKEQEKNKQIRTTIKKLISDADLTAVAALLFKNDNSSAKIDYEKIRTYREGENTDLDSPVRKPIPFDLMVYYSKYPSWYRLFVDCRIIGEAEVASAAPTPGGDASSSGMPLIEQYTFICKEVITRNLKTQGETYAANSRTNPVGRALEGEGVRPTVS